MIPRQGWEKTDEGALEPVWSCGPVLPTSLIGLIEKTAEEAKEVQKRKRNKKLTMKNVLVMISRFKI